jgi:hypothetical protein
MNYKTMKTTIDDIKVWAPQTFYDRKDEYQKLITSIIDHFRDRVDLSSKRFVQSVDIDNEIVSRRLSKHCAYTNGHYVGKVYLDQEGNIFETIASVKEKCGEEAIFCMHRCYGEKSYSTQYYAECVYIPEIDCILVAKTSCHFTADLHAINDNNDHLQYIIVSEPSYSIVTKDMFIVGENSYPSKVKDSYYNDDLKIVGMIEASKKMFNLNVGVVNVGGNKYIPLDTLKNLSTYASYKAKLEHKSGKIQNKIDELVAMNEFNSAPMANRMPHEVNSLICKTNINKINDNLCVIRWSYSYLNESFDGMRVYIDGKDVYACKRNNQGQFVRVALSTLNQKNFAAEYNSELVMDDMTGTRLEWYANIINKLPEKHRMTLMMMFLTDVRIEQLVKLGFVDAICKKLEDSTTNIGTVIRMVAKVDEAEENNKNIYRWLGVNKYQMCKIFDLCAKTSYTYGKENANDMVLDVIGDIKTIFNKRDISHYDNRLFDEMMAAYQTFFARYKANQSWYKLTPASIEIMLNNVKEMDDTGVMECNMLRYIPTLLTISDWDRYVFRTYEDFIDMVHKMGIRQKIKLYPNTQEELVSMHDDAQSVFNMHKDKYQRDAFVARVETWKKFEYESDDFEFCVKTPEKPEDLAVEGFELRHCVKSYIDRVANGQTNVLFIRKKNELDKPFFTVELTNDRVIRQVHGFGNRNADTEPNMVEFVNRWAKNKRLKLGSFNSARA